jgi:hypothetical protein
MTPAERKVRDERIRDLRYVDGMTCQGVAMLMGIHPTRVRQVAPGRPGKIDNTLLCEAFQRSGRTATSVARELGWGPANNPDGGQVNKTLGLTMTGGGGHKMQYRQYRRMIDAGTAGRIADVLGIGRWEIGA